MSDRFGTDLLDAGLTPVRLEQPDAVQIMRSAPAARHVSMLDDGLPGHEINRRTTQQINSSHASFDPEFDPSL